MLRARIQNKIGGSMATLPVCTAVACGLWWAPEWSFNKDSAMALLLCVLTAALIYETNNSNLLIRVRSHMISATWMLVMGCMGVLHHFQPSSLAMLCMAFSYYLLFRTYQHPNNVADIFHTFLVMTLGCVFVPQMILLLPFYYWHLMVFMRALTFRGFWAGMLGVAVLGWVWAAWCLYQGDFDSMVEWWRELSTFSPITMEAYASVSRPLWMAWGVVGVLGIYCSLVYLLNSYNDKIRVRMYHYIYIFQSTLIMLLVALQPQHAQRMLPLMVLSTSPAVAHYFTLTRTLWCSIMMWLALLALGAVAWCGMGGMPG